MANSDIIKIGFDYRASLAQFEKDTNGVFDGISDKAGKQKITIQLDAKDDKVIDKIKELQKLKLDKFTFEFGDSGLKEQLQTFDKLENKINEIISLSKRIDLSFNTKNKTEAYNQLKKYADAFKNFYGNEEVMATNAGAKAGYAYYKAYEEALRKGVAQSKLEKVTIDFDVNSPFRTKENVVERRIEEFKKFQKYGDTDENTLIEEIAILENRLLKFNSAYSQVKANLGDAPITPEITKNIEEYVRWLEIAESRAKDAELFGGYSSEDFNSDKDLANMYLDFAKEGATTENKKYIESLKQEETQAVATAEAEQKLAEAQKNLSSIGSDDISEKNILNVQKQLAEIVNKTTISFEDLKVVLNALPDNKIVQLNKTLDRTSDLTSDVGTSLSVMTSELGKFFTIEGVRSSTSFFLNNNGEFTRKPDKRKTSFSNDPIYTSEMRYDYSEVAKIAYNKLKDLSLPNVSQDVNKINELTQSYNKLNNEIEKWIDNNVNKQMSPATYNFDDHENAIKLMQNYIGELNQLKSNDGYTYMSQSIKDNVEQSINYLSKLISVSEKAIETQNRFKSQDKLDNEIRKMTGTTAGDEYNKYFSMLSQGTEIEDILEQVRKDFDLTYNEATQKWEKISSVISSTPQESNFSSGTENSTISLYDNVVDKLNKILELRQKIAQSPTLENGLEGKGEFLKFAEQYKWSPYKDTGFLGESNIKAGYGIYTKAQTKFAKGEVDETYVNNAYTTFVKILTDNLVHSVSGITTGKTDVDYIKQRLQEILPKKMSSFIDEYLDNITSFSKRNAEYNSGGNYIDEESKALKELIELGSGVNQRAEDIFTIDAKDDLQNLFDETKISAENFQSVLESVCNILGIEIPQNTEKAKEFIKEVTSTADSPSSTSNPSIEHQIKSESELNAEIEKRENIIRELQQLQEKLTVHEDFHGNDKYFADQLPTEEEIREADKRIKQLTGTNNIFDVQKLIQDRNEWLSEVKYSLEEYDDLIKTNDQKALDEYTTRGLSRIDGAESFFGYEDNNFSIASKFAEEKEKIQNEINDLYIDLDKLDEKMNLDSNNSSVNNTVQSQEKLQSELKETQEQAEKTAQAIEDTTFQTNQIKNTETISAEQFTKIESLFESIKESLSSIKSVLVDVGDGEELSPLLKTIDNINTSIINLNSDVLYQDTEKSFWTQASSAAGQVTKVFNEMKAASGTNPLADMFGKTDLSEVISQLGLIVAKLEEISTTASSFKNVFDNGFNITASVEEIDKLTNRVKELEDELSKVKLNPANVDKSNISSGTKDAFPDSSTDTKSETEGMEQVKKTTEEAVQAKKDFATANKGVQSSIDGSENPLKLEAELMEQIAKSAREAANAKKEFVEANKQVKDSADGSNNDLNSGNKKGRYAKAVKLSNDDFMSKYDDFLKKGNELASKTNGSILGGNVNVSYDDVNGLAKVSAKIKDVDGNWRIFSAKLDSDLNVFSQSFKIITSNVKNLDRQLNQLNQENQEVSRSFIFEPNTEGFDDIIAKFGILREQAEQITKIVKATKQTADGADISYKATLKNGSSYYLGENSTPQVLNASETIYDSNAIEKAYQEATKVNNALNKTNSLLNSLKVPNDFEGSFSTLKSEVQRLNSEFGSGKISATEYASSIKKAFSDYKTPIDNRSKDIWNELTTSLNRYATLQKRIANNNALSTDNEEATRLLEHIHELQRNDILPTDKLTASNEKLQQINQTVTDLKAKLKESTLDSLQGSIDKYQKIYDQRSTHSSDFTPSEQYNKNLAELDTAIRDLVEYKDTLKNVGEVTVEQETYLKGLVTACEKASDSFKSLSASEKGASQLAVNKLVQRINKDLDENTNYSKQAKQGLRALRDELESANPRNLKEITSEIINIENAEIRAGHAGRSFIDTLKNSGFHQLAAQIAGMFGFDDAINLIKEGINTVRELDTAMTEVRKVSDATEAQYASFRDIISSTAKEIASTNKELLNSSADFLRLGYSLDQASDLAKNATLFVNVGDGVDITEATEDMITAMKAFDIKAEDSIKIVDDYNQIGNRFALSASDIGEAMKRSASALETGNNSFEQSISLITAMNEIVQNSENTGNSLKVLSLRLRGAKAELENMQEDTDGLCESTSKLREQIKALTGVDIMLDDNTFKSTTDIIKELGTVWDKLSDSSQAATLELIAGKSRANNVAALLKNYQKIDEVMESLGDAEGSALRENEAIVNSID